MVTSFDKRSPGCGTELYCVHVHSAVFSRLHEQCRRTLTGVLKSPEIHLGDAYDITTNQSCPWVHFLWRDSTHRLGRPKPWTIKYSLPGRLVIFLMLIKLTCPLEQFGLNSSHSQYSFVPVEHKCVANQLQYIRRYIHYDTIQWNLYLAPAQIHLPGRFGGVSRGRFNTASSKACSVVFKCRLNYTVVILSP